MNFNVSNIWRPSVRPSFRPALIASYTAGVTIEKRLLAGAYTDAVFVVITSCLSFRHPSSPVYVANKTGIWSQQVTVASHFFLQVFVSYNQFQEREFIRVPRTPPPAATSM